MDVTGIKENMQDLPGNEEYHIKNDSDNVSRRPGELIQVKIKITPKV